MGRESDYDPFSAGLKSDRRHGTPDFIPGDPNYKRSPTESEIGGPRFMRDKNKPVVAPPEEPRRKRDDEPTVEVEKPLPIPPPKVETKKLGELERAAVDLYGKLSLVPKNVKDGKVTITALKAALKKAGFNTYQQKQVNAEFRDTVHNTYAVNTDEGV